MAQNTTMKLPATVEVKLRAVRRRVRLFQFVRGVLLTFSLLLAMMLLAMGIDWLVASSAHGWRVGLSLIVLGVSVVVLFVSCLIPLVRRRPLEKIAEIVDHAVPQLEERWSTVTELSQSQDPPEVLGAKPLIEQVAREAEQAGDFIVPKNIIPTRSLNLRAMVFVTILAIFVIALAAAPFATFTLLKRFWAPWSNISLTRVTALTGDRVIPKGEALRLEAKIAGRRHATATLHLRDSRGQEHIELDCSEKPGENLTWKINAIKNDFSYRWSCGDGDTGWHAVKAIERPSLAEVALRIVPPAYSKIAVAEFKSLPPACRALEGSRMELAFLPSKPLARMELQVADKTTETLAAAPDKWYRFGSDLNESMTFTALLTDQYGLTNPAPPTCNIEVYADQAPLAEIVSPNDQVQAREDDKVAINFQLSDDFGLAKAELVVTDSSNGTVPLQVIPIPINEKDLKNFVGQVELDLKSLNVKNGMQIDYSIRVTDSREVSSLSRSSDENENQSMPPGEAVQNQNNEAANLQQNEDVKNDSGQANQQPELSASPQQNSNESHPGQINTPQDQNNSQNQQQQTQGGQPNQQQQSDVNQQQNINPAESGQAQTPQEQSNLQNQQQSPMGQQANPQQQQTNSSQQQNANPAERAQTQAQQELANLQNQQQQTNANQQQNANSAQQGGNKASQQQSSNPENQQQRAQASQQSTPQQQTNANQQQNINSIQQGQNQTSQQQSNSQSQQQQAQTGQQSTLQQQSNAGQQNANQAQQAQNQASQQQSNPQNQQQQAQAGQQSNPQQQSNANQQNSNQAQQGQNKTSQQQSNSQNQQQQAQASQQSTPQQQNANQAQQGQNQTAQQQNNSQSQQQQAQASQQSNQQQQSAGQQQQAKAGQQADQRQSILIGDKKQETKEASNKSGELQQNQNSNQNQNSSAQSGENGKKEENKDQNEQQKSPSQQNQQQPNQQNNNNTMMASNSKSASSESKPMQGAKPPSDNMIKKQLPLPQVGSSSRLSIRVSEWAGQPPPAATEKLQIDIEKYLSELKRLLGSARNDAIAISTRLHALEPWSDTQSRQIQTAATAVHEAEKNVAELDKLSANSPYAFIGMQILDIGRSHITPAAGKLTDTILKLQNPPEQLKLIEEAQYHLDRALEKLIALNKQYEKAKSKQKTADALLEVAKMHQLFVENMKAFLKTCKPTLNPRDPKGVLKFSDEYIKKLQEQLDQLKKLQEELAKALAKDPDLQRRLMALTRKQGTTIRDQLTILAQRQGTLGANVRDWSERGKTAEAELKGRLHSEQSGEQLELSTAAALLSENFMTWVPRDVGTTSSQMKEGIKTSNDILLASRELARLIQTGQADAAIQGGGALLEKIDDFDRQINDLTLAGNGSENMFEFTGKRLDETRKLRARETAWLEKVKAGRDGRFGKVGELDQYGLMMDTSTYGKKLEKIAPILLGLSPEIGKKMGELVQQVKTDAIGHQTTAGKALSEEKLHEARDAENKTTTTFALSERTYDEMLDLVDQYLAKNAQAPDEPDPLPELEDILKKLQHEMETCEKLGDAGLIRNFSVKGDWSLPGDDGLFGGGGGGGEGSSGESGQGSGQPTPSQQQSGNQQQTAMQAAAARMQEAQAAFQQALQRMQGASRTENARLAKAAQATNPSGTMGMAPPQTGHPRTEGRDWNVFVSKLKQDLQQGRGNVPPEQYRQAIDDYFRAIYAEAARENGDLQQ